MDNIKMGQFISELRKSHQMTQKDLAEKLNDTDKSVSKWERGLSCPDISLLTPLSDILGVSVSDLLNGNRSSTEEIDVEADLAQALRYADAASKGKVELIQAVGTAAFSSLIFLGIIICAIVDVAISGTFTWSLIPISACVFTWLVLVPTM